MSDNGEIAITGIGRLSTLGTNFAEISASLLAGKYRHSRGRRLRRQPASLPDCRPNRPARLPRDARSGRYDALYPLEKCVLWCCTQRSKTPDSGPSGAICGSAWCWASRPSGFFTGMSTRGAAAGSLRRGRRPRGHGRLHRRMLGLTGPALSVAAACASGNHARPTPKNGWKWAGSTSAWPAPATSALRPTRWPPSAISGPCRGATTTRPVRSRPFDCDRDGMVLGEGGAVFVLESAEAARARGPPGLRRGGRRGRHQRRVSPGHSESGCHAGHRRHARRTGRGPHRSKRNRLRQRACHRHAGR